MQLDSFNNHRFHEIVQEIKELLKNSSVLKTSDDLELSFLVNTVISVEADLKKINAFLLSTNDLDNIANYLYNILGFLKQLGPNSNIQYIKDQIRTYLLNITRIISAYPSKNKQIVNSDFNTIASFYKKDAEAFKYSAQKALNEYKNNLNNALNESNANKDYLNNLVGDIKDFSSKYTTKEKAKYYAELSDKSEDKADKFLKYTNIAMFVALGFIGLPILLPMLCNVWSGNWHTIFPSDILNLSFGGAILRISVSFLALLPALFFSQIEKTYRERAFKFKDLSNAILSINPYLADIETNGRNEYDEKEKCKLEMAKIFFTQIHSNHKSNDKDLLKKMEQIANIVKGIKQ